MASHLSDEELIEELRTRFEENKRALFDLRIVSAKLAEVNKKLLESEQMKSNFLSNIRNEIINPLSSILGLSYEMAHDAPPDEPVARFASMIHDEAFGLDFQIRNIFMAAEIEAGEAVVAPSISNIGRILTDAVDSFSPRAASEGKVVSVSLDPAGPATFRTDSEKLYCIVSNLLANAIEYSMSGGRIELSARLRDGRLVLAVRDEGIGIDRDRQKEIFDRFRQIDEGVCKAHRGHGLGLSIVKALVEFMGGTIHLDSTPGKGSAFVVTLPESEGAAADVFSEGGNEFIFDGEEEVL